MRRRTFKKTLFHEYLCIVHLCLLGTAKTLRIFLNYMSTSIHSSHFSYSDTHKARVDHADDVALSVRRICRYFAHRAGPVLQDISFDVKRGRSLAIIGSSGCGKSVLLKILLGLLPASSGSYTWGHCQSQQNHDQALWGVVFQTSALLDSMTVLENVAFVAQYGPLAYKRSVAEKRALEMLNFVGLKDSAQLYPAALSGGMQRRVALARAMMVNPSFLILDEVTAGLDPLFAQSISHLIAETICTYRTTTLMVTHDIQSVKTIADDVLMLENAQVIWHGPKEEFLQAPHKSIEAFLLAAGAVG